MFGKGAGEKGEKSASRCMGHPCPAQAAHVYEGSRGKRGEIGFRMYRTSMSSTSGACLAREEGEKSASACMGHPCPAHPAHVWQGSRGKRGEIGFQMYGTSMSSTSGTCLAREKRGEISFRMYRTSMSRTSGPCLAREQGKKGRN